MRNGRGLKYKGGAFLPDIPARDLSAEEVEQHGREALLASGLYEEVPEPVKRSEKTEKEKDDGSRT